MGRTIRGALLALPVALVVSLVLGAAGASAKLPEYGKCVATESGTGGRYLDAGCIEKAKRHHGEFVGEFEWIPLEEEKDFEPLELEGPMTFETQSGDKVECAVAGEFDSAELTGLTSQKTPLWVFEGCSSEGEECHSSVSIEPGEITNSFAWHEEAEEEGQPVPGWTGRLGFVAKGPEPVVGVEYNVKNAERLFPPVACSGAVGTIWFGGNKKGGNSFISTIGPTNEMTKTFAETFSESAPGIQAPAKLAGRHAVYIQAFRNNQWERMAISGPWIEHAGRSGFEIKTLP
ncbi:MAG TPA: hypothetical protein VH061_06530 [Solirubrobacteraceae bacterium]|nr:hypothetical protein [Solirubrobacteraceae bacterium]